MSTELNTLYDSNAVMYVLGSLMRQPSLAHENKYILTSEDFIGLHSVVFSAIYNLSMEVSGGIDPVNVDLYLKQYPTQYESYKKNDGFDYLLNLNALVNADFDLGQFDFYYGRTKKFTILRDLSKAGLDTKQFYDPNITFSKIEEQNRKFNEFEVSDIFNRVREKVAVIEDKNVSKTNLKVKKAGQGLRSLLEELKASPETGFPLEGDMLNFATRGARLGKMYLYSAPSGHGKSRFFVGNACALSMPFIKDGKIHKRKDLAKVLFVATEMDPDEIQTLILAFVSGVDEEKILMNLYTKEEEKSLQMALSIIEEYSENFIIEKVSDPSVGSLRSKLTKYVIQDEIYHIFYDYIFTSPALNMEFSKNGLREDVVLMMMANTLKEIASDFNVFVYTGTQVNREWEKRHFRNENNIAGSKAIADKADFGVVATKIQDSEFEAIQEILIKSSITLKPNIVLDVYKNRRGKITNAKIFRYFDYGTCRAVDLLMTDTNYHKWEVNGKIEYKTDLLDLSISSLKGSV